MHRLSVVAQNVVLTISPAGNQIVEVHHDKAEQISNGVYQLNLGDLYAEGECSCKPNGMIQQY